jgi:hypothetical protein
VRSSLISLPLPLLTAPRHVHDRKHTSDLLYLHGVHPVQNTRHGRPRHPAHVCALRNPKQLRPPARRQGRLYPDQPSYAGSGHLESKCHGAAPYDEIGLASLGRRAHLVGASCSERVVVVYQIVQKNYIPPSHGAEAGFVEPGTFSFFLSDISVRPNQKQSYPFLQIPCTGADQDPQSHLLSSSHPCIRAPQGSAKATHSNSTTILRLFYTGGTAMHSRKPLVGA